MKNRKKNALPKATLNDPPNPHFLDYTDAQLRAYIANPGPNLGDLALSAAAAQKELSRRELARAAFLT